MSSDVPETETKVVSEDTQTQIIINNDRNNFSGLEISAIVSFVLMGVGGLGYLTRLYMKDPQTFKELFMVSVVYLVQFIKAVISIIPVSLIGVYNIFVDILNKLLSGLDIGNVLERKSLSNMNIKSLGLESYSITHILFNIFNIM